MNPPLLKHSMSERKNLRTAWFVDVFLVFKTEGYRNTSPRGGLKLHNVSLEDGKTWSAHMIDVLLKYLKHFCERHTTCHFCWLSQILFGFRPICSGELAVSFRECKHDHILGCPPSQDASDHQDYEPFLGSGIPT